jgi:DNA-binding MarR family transcriptional regulator
MNKMNTTESSFELWRLIGRVNHSILVHRQRELRKHNIPVRQLWVLVAITEFGPSATLAKVAKELEREPNVISLQTVIMEKDGLIKRIKNTPKSNLLKLELTEKGRDIINASRHSEAIHKILGSLPKEDRQYLDSILNKVLIKAHKYHQEPFQ